MLVRGSNTLVKLAFSCALPRFADKRKGSVAGHEIVDQFAEYDVKDSSRTRLRHCRAWERWICRDKVDIEFHGCTFVYYVLLCICGAPWIGRGMLSKTYNGTDGNKERKKPRHNLAMLIASALLKPATLSFNFSH